MTTTTKRSEVPTAAAVQELLDAPERARRQAEAQATAEGRAPAQAALRAALEARLTVPAAIHDELTRWFAQRPSVSQATYEEMLGAHAREWIDRVVKLGRDLLDSTGSPVHAAARQWIEALRRPLDADSFHAALATLTDLEEREPLIAQRAATWRTLRASTAEQLRGAIRETHTQAEWLEGAPHV